MLIRVFISIFFYFSRQQMKESLSMGQIDTTKGNFKILPLAGISGGKFSILQLMPRRYKLDKYIYCVEFIKKGHGKNFWKIQNFAQFSLRNTKYIHYTYNKDITEILKNGKTAKNDRRNGFNWLCLVLKDASHYEKYWENNLIFVWFFISFWGE